ATGSQRVLVLRGRAIHPNPNPASSPSFPERRVLGEAGGAAARILPSEDGAAAPKGGWPLFWAGLSRFFPVSSSSSSSSTVAPAIPSPAGNASPSLAMEYQQAAQWAAQHLESYRKDPSGWSGCKRSNNVTISWRPSNIFRGNLYRAEGILAAKSDDVLKCMMPETGGLREKWDDNVSKLVVVESINNFLDVVLVQQNEDGSKMTVATNVEHPLSPPQPNYVRGLNFPCGCFLVPVPG
ncbi:putative StAR-related lipid transfer protein, partial [Naja naja]